MTGKNALLFPADDFIEERKTVKTASGEKTVLYRSYKHLTYVANPVDADYQSLDVSVPVAVDGRPVDAQNAPILFFIGVGGYMSSRNRGGVPGGPHGPGGPGGPDGPGGPGGPGGPPGADIAELALAAGFVVVQPGCRGRDNRFPDGTYYGKAPAAIVDLKAAVRYIRHNAGLMPGNPERIVSTGGSAGGALSALLAASGNSGLYDGYLRKIGAADERDDIFGSASYSAITNLENADGAYEWEFGALSATPIFGGGAGQIADPALSAELTEIFKNYQNGLALEGKNGFGTLTSENLADYLLLEYAIPSANRFLRGLGAEDRDAYLAGNPWISWNGDAASFSFGDYAAHCGRMKTLPAFDDFGMRMAEPILFGSETVDARHFTGFSLRHTTGDPGAGPEAEVKALADLMNPMFLIRRKNPGCAPHWWIRHGGCDGHTALPVIANLATALENFGRDVNARLVWDGGHCADDDPEGFIAWMGRIAAQAT